MSILSGIRIIEIEGIGPAPFCGMHLADMGADVVVVERPSTGEPPVGDIGHNTIYKRNKRIVQLDLKDSGDRAKLLEMVKHADGLIEGMRPGVMERLELGPSICHEVNPALAYGRVTGWGQTGPLSQAAGHDINYIALSGALWYAGRPGEPPFAPPTLAGDIGGGALYLTIGMLACILNAQRTGKGDVVDAAMVDGSAHMMNLVLSLRSSGTVVNERGKSILDGPHWFDTYECSDGKFVSVGALEPHFYKLLIDKIGVAEKPEFAKQFDIDACPNQKEAFKALFASKTQLDWCELLEGTDACFAPVLNPDEAAEHPHMQSRNVYGTHNEHLQAQAAPRFTHSANQPPRNAIESDFDKIISSWLQESR